MRHRSELRAFPTRLCGSSLRGGPRGAANAAVRSALIAFFLGSLLIVAGPSSRAGSPEDAQSREAAFSEQLAAKADKPAPPRPKDDAEAAVFAKLDAPVDVSFDEVPLRDVLRALARDSTLAIRRDDAAINEVGAPLGAEVTVHLEGVSLRSVLKLLLEPLQLAEVVTGAGLLITSRKAAEAHDSDWVYDVRDLRTRGVPLGSLADVIQATVEPQSWKDRGGDGSLESQEKALVIRQNRRALAEIDRLLGAVRGAFEGSGISAGRAAVALARPISVAIADEPFSKALEQLGRKAGVGLFVSRDQAGRSPIDLGTSVSLTVTQQPLREALETLLGPLDLDWYAISNGSIAVSSPLQAAAQYEVRAYRISDLLKGGRKAPALVEQITTEVQPGTWTSTGGPATIEPLDGLLVVRHNRRAHEALEELLEKMDEGGDE